MSFDFYIVYLERPALNTYQMSWDKFKINKILTEIVYDEPIGIAYNF